MALINTSLPNLIQGVSQQPDALRYDGQCEEQENALSSVVDGLTKRPNTRHVARLLQSAIDADSFIHFIDRSDSEKYVVIHDGSTIRAWNTLTGVEATIDGATGGVDISSHAYLNPTTPRADLKALTVADNTFLLNTTISTSIDASTTSPALDKRAFVFIKQADYGKRYTIEFGEGDTLRLEFLQAAENSGPTPYTAGEFGIAYAGSNYDASTAYIFEFTGVPALGTQYVQGLTDANGEFTQLRRVYSDGTPFSGSNGTYAATVFLTVPKGTTTSSNIFNFNYPSPNISDQGSLGFGSITQETGDSSTASNARSSEIAYRLHLKSTDSSAIGYNASVAANFDVNLNGNGVLYQLKASSTADDFAISTRDDLADSGMAALYKETDSLTDLPLTCINGFVIKIKGDADLDQDDYYVKFVTADGSSWSSGSWEETIGPETPLGFKASTMPHRLVSTGLNTFELSEIDYNQRTAGDAISNPSPSFVGYPISNMFFFKNRLGFISNENVILSEAGNVFNFFRNTVTTLLDSAPIDVSVSSGRVTNLEAATGFQENLVLFGQRGQFVLKGGELLTPKTVSITPITNFDFDAQVAPLPLGSYVYFPFSRGSFSGIREFTVNATSDTYDSVDVTNHVPSYIPNNITQMDGTSSEDILVLVSSNEPSAAYVYKYFWSGNQKVLSAWSRFSIKGDIRGIHFVESTLYMVVAHNSETQLLEMPLESGLKDNAGYNTYLDQRIEDTVLSGNSTITLPYTPADDSVQVYTKDGLKLTATNVGATVTLAQPVSEDTDVWVGYPYTMKYTFSEQLFKASTGNSKSPSAASKLMVRNGALFFDDTAYFQVKVTPKARQTYVNTFTPDVVGSTTIGELNLDSGFYRFPVFTKAADTTITIENDSALPSNFQSAEFESFVHSRSNRYG